MKLQLLKGTKDSQFEEQIIKEQIIETLKKHFKIHGYSPLETPILELYEILASKYAGGAEILKETYKLTDQGNREIALMNPQLQFPIKRYEIGKAFRDGPIKLGRLREFTQCDCDAIGIKEMTVDAELIMMALQIFEEFDFDMYMEINNRKLLTGLLIEAGISDENQGTVILSIDKIKKIGEAGVQKELTEKGISEDSCSKVFEIFRKLENITKEYFSNETKTNIGSINEYFDEILKIGTNENITDGIKELKDLFLYLTKFGLTDKDIKEKIVLNLSLARGLNIYTSTVFEGFLKESKVKSSICAGGRWDNIIGKFLDSNQTYPAIGLSFGLDVIYAAMKNKLDDEATLKQVATDVFVIPIKCLAESLSLVGSLRKAGINTDFDQLGRSIGKNMNFANKKGIPYVIIIGQKELEENKFTLRDMKSGNEEKLSIEDIISKLIK